jgi:hypothetical protein
MENQTRCHVQWFMVNMQAYVVCLLAYVGVCGVMLVNQAMCHMGWLRVRMWAYVGVCGVMCVNQTMCHM